MEPSLLLGTGRLRHRRVETFPASQKARLLRSDDQPSVFTSVSEWADPASLHAWKASQGFQDGMGSARELCNEFIGGDFGVASAIDPG